MSTAYVVKVVNPNAPPAPPVAESRSYQERVREREQRNRETPSQHHIQFGKIESFKTAECCRPTNMLQPQALGFAQVDNLDLKRCDPPIAWGDMPTTVSVPQLEPLVQTSFTARPRSGG